MEGIGGSSADPMAANSAANSADKQPLPAAQAAGGAVVVQAIAMPGGAANSALAISVDPRDQLRKYAEAKFEQIKAFAWSVNAMMPSISDLLRRPAPAGGSSRAPAGGRSRAAAARKPDGPVQRCGEKRAREWIADHGDAKQKALMAKFKLHSVDEYEELAKANNDKQAKQNVLNYKDLIEDAKNEVKSAPVRVKNDLEYYETPCSVGQSATYNGKTANEQYVDLRDENSSLQANAKETEEKNKIYRDEIEAEQKSAAEDKAKNQAELARMAAVIVENQAKNTDYEAKLAAMKARVDAANVPRPAASAEKVAGPAAKKQKTGDVAEPPAAVEEVPDVGGSKKRAAAAPLTSGKAAKAAKAGRPASRRLDQDERDTMGL